MKSLWISFKENYVYCGTKRPSSAAFLSPTKLNKRNNNGGYENESSSSSSSSHHKELVRPLIMGPTPLYNFSLPRLYELNNGDASRNVIEIIFKKASINHYLNSSSPRIRKVFRVKNPTRALETFERYRDEVKEKSNEQDLKMHPRSAVDGNELLRFFSTTVMCSGSGSSKRASQLCDEPNCGLCSILESNLEEESVKKKGIRLSSWSEGLREKNTIIPNNRKNFEKAVIVCRVIAGMVDKKDEVSVVRKKLEYLVVRDPNAVLPCFVIVFSS